MMNGFADSPVLVGTSGLWLPQYGPSLFFSVKSGSIAPVLLTLSSEYFHVGLNPP